MVFSGFGMLIIERLLDIRSHLCVNRKCYQGLNRYVINHVTEVVTDEWQGHRLALPVEPEQG